MLQQMTARRIAKTDLLQLGTLLSSPRCCCNRNTAHSRNLTRSMFFRRIGSYLITASKARPLTLGGHYFNVIALMPNYNHVKQVTSKGTSGIKPCHFHVQNRMFHSAASLLMWYYTGMSISKFYPTCVSPIRIQIRPKSKGKKTGKEDLYEESSDEESEGIDVYNAVEELQDLVGAPDNFTLVKVHVKALRADAVASVGLNMARNKMDELFYKSKLLLNGEKLLKKSAKMDVGNYVDIVTGTKDERTMVKRVQLVQILKERTKSDKQIVWLRVWKSEFPVDVDSW